MENVKKRPLLTKKRGFKVFKVFIVIVQLYSVHKHSEIGEESKGYCMKLLSFTFQAG